MPKKIQLHIPTPCHEDWDKMTTIEKGKYCNSCKKNVIDFTGMSDSQLVSFFKKPQNNNTCGRFLDEQLNRNFDIPKKRIPFAKYVVQILLPLFFAGLKSYSQGSAKIKVDSLKESSIGSSIDISKTILGNVSSFDFKKIEGHVFDKSGNPIPYSSIVLKETKTGTTTDSNGYYSIPGFFFNSHLTLIASSLGYISDEKTIGFKDDDNINFILDTNPVLLNEVVVCATDQTRVKCYLGGVSVSRITTLFDDEKSLPSLELLKVYPNPAKAGTTVNIEIKDNIQSEFLIQIFSLQGQLIKSLGLFRNESGKISLIMPFVKPGAYLLRLTNKKNLEFQSNKLIIQ